MKSVTVNPTKFQSVNMQTPPKFSSPKKTTQSPINLLSSRGQVQNVVNVESKRLDTEHHTIEIEEMYQVRVKLADQIALNLKLQDENNNLKVELKVWKENYDDLLLKAKNITVQFDNEMNIKEQQLTQLKQQYQEDNLKLRNEIQLLIEDNEKLSSSYEDISEKLSKLTQNEKYYSYDQLKQQLTQSQKRENKLFQDLLQTQEYLKQVEESLHRYENYIQDDNQKDIQLQVQEEKIKELMKQNNDLSQIIMKRCSEPY